MLLLIGFALLAGAGTALSPCVLPILPVVAVAGVSGGRRRPLGIVVGLALSFTFAAVALVYLIEALGLPNNIQRVVAIVVLVGFGLSLLVPAVGDRIEAFLSRLVGAPRMRQGEGFGSGLALGAALGLVYFPCAGPILAGVITLSASQQLTIGRIAIVLAYAIGSSVVLYVLLLGGRRLIDRVKPARGRIQAATGVVMIAAALVLALELDRDFEQSIATGLPDFVTNPTTGLERSAAVSSGLAEVRGADAHAPLVQEASAAEPPPAPHSSQPPPASTLPILNTGPVPDLTNPGQFFNTPGGAPVSIHELTSQGKTVLVDFWTYTCINCIRTLPYLESWYQHYADDGLVVIGVHTPEFPFERDAGNVGDAIASNHLTYPVVQDNDYGTWNAFGNQYWPADYLIDSNGDVRDAHFGEGDYDATESAIRSLLAESGGELGSRAGRVHAPQATPGVRLTPETYLGAARAQGWVDPVSAGDPDFGKPGAAPPPNGFAYSGAWHITDESATAGPAARIDASFDARRVFLVLGSPDRERQVRVLLDGKPIRPADAGADVEGGKLTVGAQRLYSLVDLPAAAKHRLTLELEPGVTGYAFTFG